MRWTFFDLRRQTVRDILFGCLIAVYFEAAMTFLLRETHLEWRVETVIRLLVPWVFLFGFRKFLPPRRAGLLLAVYACLALYMLVLIVFSDDRAAVLTATSKYLYVLTFPLALFLTLRPQNVTLRFTYVPVIMGVLFSLQVLTLFLLINTGHAPPKYELVLAGYKNLEMPSYGIFGYAWGSLARGSEFELYRAQSFFAEPTRLGAFLEVSVLLAWGLYRTRKALIWFLAAMLCVAAMVITFSMTTYIVIFLTLGIYFLIVHWRRWGFFAPALVTVAALAAIVVIVLYLRTAINFYSQNTAAMNLAFGHSETELNYRVDFLTDSLRLFREYPFGIGVVGLEDSRTLAKYPGAGGLIAPLVWLVFGGIVALLLQVTIISFVVVRIVIPHVRDGGMPRYLGLAFMAFGMHQCLAGDWFDPMFFYLLAGVVMTDAFRFAFPQRLKAGAPGQS